MLFLGGVVSTGPYNNLQFFHSHTSGEQNFWVDFGNYEYWTQDVNSYAHTTGARSVKAHFVALINWHACTVFLFTCILTGADDGEVDIMTVEDEPFFSSDEEEEQGGQLHYLPVTIHKPPPKPAAK